MEEELNDSVFKQAARAGKKHARDTHVAKSNAAALARLALKEKNEKAKEVIHVAELNQPSIVVTEDGLRLNGTTKPEALRMLRKLGVDITVTLNKRDTADLLTLLLTCDETQLKAVLAHPKVPILIKPIIKRLLNDAEIGSTATVEWLWAKVFGGGSLVVEPPVQAANVGDSSMRSAFETVFGKGKNVRVSRETYEVMSNQIRDTEE
jgi:hypothetical protein